MSAASAFLQLRSLLLGALQAGPALAAQVHANGVRPVDREVQSAINVRLEASRADDITTCATDWRTRVVVECYARAVAGASDPGGQAEAAADEILLGAHNRLQALPGAVAADAVGVISIQPVGVTWDHDMDAHAMACVILTLDVVHRAPGMALTPWS